VHTTIGYSQFITVPYTRSETSPGKDLFPFLSLYKPNDVIKVDEWENSWDESFVDYFNPIHEPDRDPDLLKIPKMSVTASSHTTLSEPSNAKSEWKLQTESLHISKFFGWGDNVFGTDEGGEFGPVPQRNPLIFYHTRNPQQRQLYFPTLPPGEPKGIAGDTQVAYLLTSNVYMIEMLNIKLDSYDSFEKKRGRSNILAVINANEFNTGALGVLLYEPNEPLYISLLNAQELSLRNIRCRIINMDYSPVETRGQSTITLHLRPSV